MTGEEVPIRELLHLCLTSGDQGLWEKFVRRTQPAIANVIINTIRRWREPSPSLVDDLIQETFLKLFASDRKALRGLRNEHENTIFGYLKVVASNVTKDHFRQRANLVEEVELTDPVVPPCPDGFDRVEFDRLKGQIQECLERHSSSDTCERDQRIFWLFYEQGYTAREISLIPDIELTVKGVESALQRLTRVLKGADLKSPGRGGVT